MQFAIMVYDEKNINAAGVRYDCEFPTTEAVYDALRADGWEGGKKPYLTFAQFTKGDSSATVYPLDK